MDRIRNINIIGEKVTALFETDDVSEVNLLDIAMKNYINTFAIGIVIFHTNNSSRHDEIIALRLGQLSIDNELFVSPKFSGTEDYKVRIDVEGPLEVTTEHIPGLPFKFVTPIITLRRGERIICDCVIKEGKGETHVKWRPISTFSWTQVDGGFQINFVGIGMLSGQELIRRGLSSMRHAAERRPQTLFSHTLIPTTIII